MITQINQAFNLLGIKHIALVGGGGKERQRTKETAGGKKEKQGGKGSRETASEREEGGEALSLLRCRFPWRNETKPLLPQEKATAEMQAYILRIKGISQGNFE